MRVLLLVKQFYSGGGQSTYNNYLANYLSSKNINVDVITFDNTEGTDTWGNVRVHKKRLEIIANNFFTWTMLVNMKLKEAGRDVWDENNFDVIHCNDWEVFPAALAMKKFTGKPLVVTMHSLEHQRGNASEFSSMINDFEKMALSEADLIIVNNEYTLKALSEYESKIVMIDPLVFDWQSSVLQAYSRIGVV